MEATNFLKKDKTIHRIRMSSARYHPKFSACEPSQGKAAPGTLSFVLTIGYNEKG
jgi:hypothetical protein